MPEPYVLKGTRTVLRGEGGSDTPDLPDHLLLKDPQTAKFSYEIWKRFRKWGGIPTGITQNVGDLMANEDSEKILANSEFILTLSQGAIDREALAKIHNLSSHQLYHVTQSAPGSGLLLYGHVKIPFVDRFPKDTELYRIMTTRLSEL